MDGGCWGITSLAMHAFVFSIMGVFIKLSTAGGIPSVEVVLIRAIFQTIFVVPAMMCTTTTTEGDFIDAPQQKQLLLFQPFGPTHSSSTQWIVLARGLVGGFSLIFHAYTFHILPLGDGMTLVSLTPVITVFGAVWFLGEPLYRRDILAAIVSVLGSILIARPGFIFGSAEANNNNNNSNEYAEDEMGSNDEQEQYSSSSGYIAAMLAACCASSAVILTRKAGTNGVHTLQLLFAWGVGAIVCCTVITTTLMNDTIVWPPVNARMWYYVFGFCFFGLWANFFLNYGARLTPAGLTSIIKSSAILWSYCFEIVIFDQVPTLSTVIGAALVVTAIFIVTVIREQQQKEEEEECESLLPEEISTETSILLLDSSQNDEQQKRNTKNSDSTFFPIHYGATFVNDN